MKDRLLHYLRNCCESALHELYPAGIQKSRIAMTIFCCLKNLAMQSGEPAGNYIWEER